MSSDLISITIYWCLNICFWYLYPQLIFSLERYEAVIDAYIEGLEASGLNDLSRVTSVASFFVSRVDTLIDKILEKIGTPEALNLRGKVTAHSLPILIYYTSRYQICSGHDALYFIGSSSPSSSGLPALPKEIFWSKVGSSS